MKPNEFNVTSASYDLRNKTAMVSLVKQTPALPSGMSGHVSLTVNFPFDPEGDATESSIEKKALHEAKRQLMAAAQSL